MVLLVVSFGGVVWCLVDFLWVGCILICWVWNFGFAGWVGVANGFVFSSFGLIFGVCCVVVIVWLCGYCFLVWFVI